MKKRLAVDMDGVLADVVEHFLRYHERDTGQIISFRDIAGLSEDDAFPKMREHAHAKGFFRTAPVMKDSQEILQQLNDRYELFIVSAATEFPNSLSEKQQWLNEHFSFIRWRKWFSVAPKPLLLLIL